jgi:pimeloyl-ACP methyl ester carboxylesterase
MNISYIFEGESDKTLVLIHGLSDSLQYWQRLSSRLNDEYQILRYDIRGHGQSDLGDEDFTIDLLVDDLHHLISELDLDKVSLIGFSMGGNIALAFAIKYPESVDRLIVMSSFSENDENLKSRFIEFQNAIDISFETFYDVIINYVLPEDVIERNREVLECAKIQSAKTANPEGIRMGIDMGSSFSITGRLSSISAPTMILQGRDDDIVSMHLADVLNDNIRNSQLMVFDDTKHNLLIGRNFDEIIELIRIFL